MKCQVEKAKFLIRVSTTTESSMGMESIAKKRWVIEMERENRASPPRRCGPTLTSKKPSVCEAHLFVTEMAVKLECRFVS
jgi:hypothetical protein